MDLVSKMQAKELEQQSLLEKLQIQVESRNTATYQGSKPAMLLEDKYFARLAPFNGNKDKWKSWLFDFLVNVGMINKTLSTEILRLLVRKAGDKEDPYKYDVSSDRLLKEEVKKYGGGIIWNSIEIMSRRLGTPYYP